MAANHLAAARSLCCFGSEKEHSDIASINTDRTINSATNHIVDPNYNSDDEEEPLLSEMPRRNVYGRQVAAKRSAATFLFPSSSSSSSSPSTNSRPPATTADSAAGPPATELLPTDCFSPVRRPLDDVTGALNKLQLDSTSNDGIDEISDTKKGKGKEKDRPVEDQKSRHAWLQPLRDVYKAKNREDFVIQTWNDVLGDDWEFVKIAESSYAEVYKVTNDGGTSVIKLMALKPPKGIGSQRQTAVTVESVISELEIMDMMGEVVGFLEFKDAHIIEGKAPKALEKAFQVYNEKEKSFFPRPSSYPKQQLFIALELGDAGTDIEHFKIEQISQVWDIFLGCVVALAIGECDKNFEHRDLHEGNVCVKQVKPIQNLNPENVHKYGQSGLEITLLDYTLSRAEEEERVIYRDLNEDLELFNGSETLQSEIYKRMRIWAYFRSNGISHPMLNHEEPQFGSWEAFIPYTNVLWLYYILHYIQENYCGASAFLDVFKSETEELRRKIHPDTSVFNGGFDSANEIFIYTIKKGWLKKTDLEPSATPSL